MSLDGYVSAITTFREWVAVEPDKRDLTQPAGQAVHALTEFFLKKAIGFRPDNGLFSDSFTPHFSADKIGQAINEVLAIPKLKRETRTAFKNLQRILDVAKMADYIHTRARLQLDCDGNYLVDFREFLDSHFVTSCRRNPSKLEISQALIGVALSLEKLVKDGTRHTRYCNFLRDFIQAISVGSLLRDVGFHGPAFINWILDDHGDFFNQSTADRVAAYPQLKEKYAAHVFSRYQTQVHVVLPTFHAELSKQQVTTLHFKNPVHQLTHGASVQLSGDLYKAPAWPSYSFKVKGGVKSARSPEHAPLESRPEYYPEGFKSDKVASPHDPNCHSYWITPAHSLNMYEVHVDVGNGKIRHHRVRYDSKEKLVRFCPKDQAFFERTVAEMKQKATMCGYKERIQVTVKDNSEEIQDLLPELQKLYLGKNLIPRIRADANK